MRSVTIASRPLHRCNASNGTVTVHSSESRKRVSPTAVSQAISRTVGSSSKYRRGRSTRIATTIGVTASTMRRVERADVHALALVERTDERPDGTAVGRRFGYGTPDIEIVGVVEDARVNRVQEPATPMAFFPIG